MGFMLGALAGGLVFAIAVVVAGVRNTSCGQHIGAGMGNGILAGVVLWLIQDGPLNYSASTVEFLFWILAAIAGVWICAWLITCLAYDADSGQGIVMATVVTIGNALLYLISWLLRPMI